MSTVAFTAEQRRELRAAVDVSRREALAESDLRRATAKTAGAASKSALAKRPAASPAQLRVAEAVVRERLRGAVGDGHAVDVDEHIAAVVRVVIRAKRKPCNAYAKATL